MKVNISLTIEHSVWEVFRETYPSQSSKMVEEFMKDCIINPASSESFNEKDLIEVRKAKLELELEEKKLLAKKKVQEEETKVVESEAKERNYKEISIGTREVVGELFSFLDQKRLTTARTDSDFFYTIILNPSEFRKLEGSNDIKVLSLVHKIRRALNDQF